MSESSARDPVEELAEEFLARCRRGERPVLSEYTSRYPQWAEKIRSVFPLLIDLEAARPAAPDGPCTGDVERSAIEKLERLGDYRVLREVGRGGMGIVYEAVQISLGRHVALKILPQHALLDRRHLQRFQREAKAAARLHHTNIVPVYGVGEENGLHYYVMQLIHGQSLDEVLAELRRVRLGKEHSNSKAGSDTSIHLPGQSADSTPSDTGRAYWQSVAHVGVEVAEALAYASSQGILHRDIKPSNLLLDTQGTVWVTDFGLAKAADSEDLTHTGDVVGTLRYMAPERLQGKSDPRGDVYSLGITLYELLTLRPAFIDTDRARLMQRVAQEEPPRPRKLDRRIPRDLETIVLKAMDKEPARRYRTAAEMAEDLRRFLANCPVQARPIGALERLVKWARRRPVVAGLSTAVLLLLLLVAVTASVGYLQTERALSQAQDAEAGLRRLYYAASMVNVQTAWENHNMPGLHRLLEETRDFPELGFEWYYWQRLCRIEHLVLAGHRGGVAAVAFSPDGRRLVTGGNDGTARIWDAVSGRELFSLQHPGSQVTGLAYTPDGQSLVTCSTDGKARFWDANSGRELRKFDGQNRAAITCVAGTPNGKRVIMGYEDCMARVLDAAGGQAVLSLQGPTPLPVFGASIVGLLGSPQMPAALFAASTLDSGRTGHTGPVRAVAVSADGRRLVTGSRDRTVRVWDAALGRELLPPLQHEASVAFVALSVNGQWVVTAGSRDEDQVNIWDAATGRRIRTLGVSGTMWAVTITPDGQQVVANVGGLVKFWDTASGRESLNLMDERSSYITSLAVSPDGKRLATGCLDGTARVWDTVKGRATRTLKGHTGPVWSVAVSSDGEQIISGSLDGTTRVWDGSGGELLPPLRHPTEAASVALTRDGGQIITGGSDGVVRFWDAVSGKELRSFRGHSKLVSSIAVTRDGQRLVTGGWDGIVRFWDLASGHQLLQLDGHTGRVNSLCLTLDNQRLITGSDNRIATVWDTATAEPLLSLRGYTGAIPVAVTPDGQWIITGGDDGTVRVWNMFSGRQLREFTGHTGAVTSIAVTPNGRRIISGGADGTVKLWETVSGREVLTLKGHSGPINSIAVTSDGCRLITGSGDGTVKIWEAASPQQVVLWEEQDKEMARRLAPWKRPVSGALGFIHDWLVLAPLALKQDQDPAEALDTEQLEEEARLQPQVGDQRPVDGKEYVWQKYHDDEPILDFNRFVGKLTEASVAYAVSYVFSDTQRNGLLLQVGSDDQAKVYLNREPVYKYAGIRALEVLDPIGPVTLRKGMNVLVLKVVNRAADWECCARFVDSDGNRAEGLRYDSKPEK